MLEGKKLVVTGKGKVSVHPDIIQVEMDLKGVHEIYEKVLEKSSEETQILRETFEKIGIYGKDLKTVRFSVDSKYEHYQDRKKNYKKRFIGYEYLHRLIVRFPNDNELLGHVLHQLANSPLNVEFDLKYTISDPESAKNQAIEAAVDDCLRKAEILAITTGVELKEIENIDYTTHETDVYVNRVDFMNQEWVRSHPTNQISK